MSLVSKSKTELFSPPRTSEEAFQNLEILLFKLGHLIFAEHDFAKRLAASKILSSPVVALIEQSSERLNLMQKIQTELKVRRSVFFH